MTIVDNILDFVKKSDERLKRIEKLIEQEKEVLTIDEAVSYMKLSKSYLYKLTHLRKIPFYKPLGKYIYFNRKELIDFLLKNRIKSKEEIEQEARGMNSNVINRGGA